MGLMEQLKTQAWAGPLARRAQLKAGADANLANMMSAQAIEGRHGRARRAQLAMQGARRGQQTAQASALARIRSR
jgi:hypothetical protein